MPETQVIFGLDHSTGQEFVLFLPCRHIYHITEADGDWMIEEDIERFYASATPEPPGETFRQLHSTCWECYFTLEAPDA